MGSVYEAIRDSAVAEWLRRKVFVADLILGAFLAGMALLVASSLQDSDVVDMTQPGSLLQWVLVIGPAWAIPFRRIAPGVAVIAGGVIQAVMWTVALPDSYLSMAVLLYSASASGSGPARKASWYAAAGLTAYTALGTATEGAPAYALPIVALFSTAAVALGANAANRQAYAEAAEERARELERSRRSDRDRALVEERARIARELHDVVAHGLSVIVVQAAAAQRILEQDPAGTATALHQIEQTGRNALSEMRHVLAAIRTEPDESWQPAPGLRALDDLVAEFATTGLAVSVEFGGHLPTSASSTSASSTSAVLSDPLPATVDVTAYRIVRESLTNVLKHAGPRAAASVRIDRRPKSLELRISDDGRGKTDIDGGGHGLRGMQERVEVFGGTFAAGPRPGAGFEVSVSLPLDGRAKSAAVPAPVRDARENGDPVRDAPEHGGPDSGEHLS